MPSLGEKSRNYVSDAVLIKSVERTGMSRSRLLCLSDAHAGSSPLLTSVVTPTTQLCSATAVTKIQPRFIRHLLIQQQLSKYSSIFARNALTRSSDPIPRFPPNSKT